MAVLHPVDFGHRLSHVAVGSNNNRMQTRSLSKRACSASQLYTYPAAGDVFAANASNPITFKWDTTCLDATTVSVALYAPFENNAWQKQWPDVNYADGQLEVLLRPKWWGGSSSGTLYITLSESSSDALSFLTTIPSGPSFQVTYPAEELVTTTIGGSTVPAAAANTASRDPITTSVSKQSSGGLPAGSIFAAVFFPLAVIVGAVVLYVLYVRRKQSKKRQRWSQAVDNRMSVISSHWDRTSSHHAPGTPRKSGAFSQANRRTMHSTYSAGENFAGYGAHRTDDPPEMMEVVDSSTFARPRTQFMGAGERNSRGVSFAEDAGSRVSRVSFGDSLNNPQRNTVYSQGHQRSKSSLSGAMGAALRQRPSLYTNPSSTSVNILERSTDSDKARKDSADMILSPEQTTGPWVLGEDEVNAYRSGGNEERLVDDLDNESGRRLSQFAAVQMLSAPTNAGDRSSLVSRPSSYGSQISTSALATVSSPVAAAEPITPLNKAATVASYFPTTMINSSDAHAPDDLLANYARQRSGSVTPATVGMTPPMGVQPEGRMSVVGENNPFRSSMYDGGVGHAQ